MKQFSSFITVLSNSRIENYRQAQSKEYKGKKTNKT
jgi:hypothetical protein